MSVSKPFVFALVCQALGAEEAREKLGVNATGLPFNSLEAIERARTAGRIRWSTRARIATTSLVPGATAEAKWRFIHDGLSRFAGRTLALNDEVYASASETNHRNQAIARLLQSYERIYCDPVEATDLYTRQCSLNVTASDLAVMGATLADGGVNPAHQGAGGRRRRLPVRAGGDGDRRVVRDVGRLALRHRAAGQERDRRRHRHRLAGQGRAGDVCAAARRRRQQRQGTARGQVSVPARWEWTCSSRSRFSRR